MNHLLVVCFVGFLASAFSQCPSDSFSFSRNGNDLFRYQGDALESVVPFVVGMLNGTVNDDDSMIVSGGIRFLEADPQPACTQENKGSIWYSYDQDEDTLQICSEEVIPGGSPRFFWNTFSSGFSRKAQGFELVDSWGYTFDGLDRSPATWEDARKTCADLGGRLPTVTELFRNNEATGTGDLGNFKENLASSPLWTIIPWVSTTPASPAYVTVQLSTGAITGFAASGTREFRCVWPESVEESFTQGQCYGPPGGECQVVNDWYTIDNYIRPSLPWASALYECNFYSATLPKIKDIHPLFETYTLTSVDGSNSNLWTKSYDGSGAISIAWSASGQGESDEPVYASNDPNSSQRFVCIAVNPGVAARVNPAFQSSDCEDGCFTVLAGKNIIVTDEVSRPPSTWSEAHSTCSAIGAQLAEPYPDCRQDNRQISCSYPATTGPEWTDLYRSPNTIATFTMGSLWTPGWEEPAVAPSTDRHFKCGWVGTLAETVPRCRINQSPQIAEQVIACDQLTNGNANGRQNPPNINPYIDPWGNAWDTEDRDIVEGYEGARDLCERAEGRLPTPGEISRVSAGRPSELPNPNNILVTDMPTATVGQRTGVNPSTGSASTALNEPNARSFRCIWPPTPSTNSFGGNKCNGNDASSPCFQTNNMVFDPFDRPSVTLPAALAECKFLNARLPTVQEIVQLVRAGAPNGNGFLWTEDANGANYVQVRWTGIESGNFTLSETTVNSAGAPGSTAHFRCLFSNYL